MPNVEVKGICVKFPFEPYDIQKNYMEKVLDCLHEGHNGILESPTGTGKTLSLLCSTLAWLECQKTKQKSTSNQNNEKETIPSIIYACRTHTQLLQAMQEMKRTAYNYMTACILGSRDQLCIDSEVVDEATSSGKVNLCQRKVKKRSCSYHKNVERAMTNVELCEATIVDVEDIVKLGQKHNFCPYFVSRNLSHKTDVTFMPYNYLLDLKMLKTRAGFGKKSIIILDEAHNIEKVCEESVSKQLTMVDLDSSVKDLGTVIETLEFPRGMIEEVDFTAKECRDFMRTLTMFRQAIYGVRLTTVAVQGTVFDGDYIFDLLNNAGINEENYWSFVMLIEQITEFAANTRMVQVSFFELKKFSELLDVVFHDIGQEFRTKIKRCFKVHIEDTVVDMGRTSRVLNFWCFSASFAMNMLLNQNIHSIILTSGTLAPLKPLISELEIKIDVFIENPHIINRDQICVKVLSRGPDKEPLISNFQNRDNPKYLQSLGMVVCNLLRAIPDGVLIFFPSYSSLLKCCRFWQQTDMWNSINNIKPIFVEPKNKREFALTIENYYGSIRNLNCNGAVFMGVCRGKISEGLDFANVNGRAVLITGLPYPPLKDPKIILKKQYLNLSNQRDPEFLTGDEWYSLEATRAINQAVGRVIRHRHDYGAIILLDSRFTNPRIKSNISLWLRNYIVNMDNFGETIRQLRRFFKNAKEKFPAPSDCDLTE